MFCYNLIYQRNNSGIGQALNFHKLVVLHCGGIICTFLTTLTKKVLVLIRVFTIKFVYIDEIVLLFIKDEESYYRIYPLTPSVYSFTAGFSSEHVFPSIHFYGSGNTSE